MYYFINILKLLFLSFATIILNEFKPRKYLDCTKPLKQKQFRKNSKDNFNYKKRKKEEMRDKQ